MKTAPLSGTSVPSRVFRVFGCLSLAMLAAAPLEASTWSGGGGTRNWSESGNWDTVPTGGTALFGLAGTSTSGTPTNIVDESFSITSLTYQYDHATQAHVTDIASGATLTVTGGAGSNALLVGGLVIDHASTPLNTTAVIQGGGTLNITADGKNITVANHRTKDGYDKPATAILDMSELAKVVIDLGTTGGFNIGSNRSDLASAHQGTKGTVRLAKESTIRAGALRVGAVSSGDSQSISSVVPSELFFGAKTVLNVNTIAVGVGNASRAAGIMKFDPSALADSPTLKIRAADGVGAVTSMTIGVAGAGTSNSQSGSVDFTGGEIDILVDNLTIGSGRGTGASATANATGSFTMDRGKVVATNVIVGQTVNGANTVAVNDGKLNINGGQFDATTVVIAERTANLQKVRGEMSITGGAEVSVSNGIVLGKGTSGTTADTATAVLNIGDGKLTSGGNIGRGGTAGFIHATLNLKGGRLDLTGHQINVDTLLLESGTLVEVGEITSGSGVVKTTTGTLTLEGTNRYTAATIVEAGTLRVDGALTNSDVTIRNGAALAGSDGSMGGAVTMETGSTLALELRGGGDYDALAIQSLTLATGVNLAIELDYAPAGGTTFTILTGLTGGYTGLFDTINGVAVDPAAFTLSYGGEDFEFRLVYDDTFISLQAIPEPGTYALLGVAGAGLLFYRRRGTI